MFKVYPRKRRLKTESELQVWEQDCKTKKPSRELRLTPDSLPIDPPFLIFFSLQNKLQNYSEVFNQQQL